MTTLFHFSKKFLGFSLLESLFAIGILGGIVLLSSHFFLHENRRLQSISEIQLLPEIRQTVELYLQKNPIHRHDSYSQLFILQQQDEGSYQIDTTENLPERPYLLLEHHIDEAVVRGTFVGLTQELVFLLPLRQ